MPIVSVQQLSKTYRVADKQPGFVGTVKHFVKRKHRDIEAVRDISFDIQPGEIVGFLGPNGAGKTTAIKMLTGLIHPSAGQVRVLDHEPFKRRADFLRQITLVMGNKQQLLWDLPAMDSLRVNAAVYAIPEDEADRRIKAFASLLELDKELTQPVRKLSLGQRMKCELVAALLHHPKVLFLDEPTLGLDVNAQTAVREFLQQYNAEHGASILLTSHYMADITALCERVVVIDKGTILYDGTLDGVIQRFAPLREVRLDLGAPVADDVLSAYGEIESNDGNQVRLLVQREVLTDTVTRLLGELEVADLTIADPPIEDVIARLFDSGKTTPEATDAAVT
ncbi:ABC transporter ATP-binding protein [Algisphaera agarilytica]|uniref:ABC-2 type transport system ATP-binding protein n=1 Tax=Algisphaera agarilytica TaxID=1385975 RepID=A0A7X0H386_9BACT|nr:ATP-binding cassette domain-containing protein [Algisphaera agarilytica]MBB6428472.1 ABC-2 type transport system ATP-binding protein [Algisphaera agarilytica]